MPGYEWLRDDVTDPERVAAAQNLAPIAAGLGCTIAQLALAWCAHNPHVSTVITGASRVEQVRENMRAVDVLERLTPDVLRAVDEAFAGIAIE